MYKKVLLAVAAATMMMGLTVSAEGETIGVSMPTKDLQRCRTPRSGRTGSTARTRSS